MTPSELNCSLPMDTPKPPQKPHHLLDDLESIREFLSHKEPTVTAAPDDFQDLPLLTDSVEMGQIPLLSDIVAPGPTTPVTAQPQSHLHASPQPQPQPRPSIPAAPAHVPPPAVARPDPSPAAATPTPSPAPGIAQAAQRSVQPSNTASDLLRLDAELRAAAQLILQDVIDDFVPQIEAELKRRLEARLTRLLPPRKG